MNVEWRTELVGWPLHKYETCDRVLFNCNAQHSPLRTPWPYHDLCELARNYCLLGATNADLAGFFDVTTRTIDNWMAVHPEGATAVREARAVADAKVARCLYWRAVGYEYTVERTVWHLGKERPVSGKLRLPRDTRACMFWLCNRQPQ